MMRGTARWQFADAFSCFDFWHQRANATDRKQRQRGFFLRFKVFWVLGFIVQTLEKAIRLVPLSITIIDGIIQKFLTLH